MTEAEMCKAFNLDPVALNSLVSYLQSNLNRSEMLRDLAKQDPEAFLTQGVKAWHAASTKFLSELAHGTSEAAEAMRHELAVQTWTTIRTRAGLPV